MISDKTIFPKVSIVMPTYNRALFIGEAIASIRAQTYTNWELIIIDDASDDNTVEVVSVFNDSRIQLHSVKKNGSCILLRKKGSEVAAGDLIAFMDSDDVWAPEKLEKQIKALEEYPDAGFSLTGGYNFINKNEPIDHFYANEKAVQYGYLLNSMFNSTTALTIPTLLMKKECVSVFNYADSLRTDIDFLIELSVHYKGIVLCAPLFYRRIHNNNHNSSDWERGYADMLCIIQNHLKRKTISDAVGTNALFKLYIHFGEKYLRSNQKKKAVRMFCKAWRYAPVSFTAPKKIAKALLK
jgi:glycosyltransferase involved in cell wall biosynthesis